MAANAMSLQDIRDFVRSALDTDTTDLPNGLLDRYIADGNNRINSFSDEWSFRGVDYTFSTVAGVQAYDVTTSARVPGITYPLIDIEDVRGKNWSLTPTDHVQQRRRYRASTSVKAANPSEFSQWGPSIYLWPIPSGATNISITGYRDGIDWISTNAAIDFPADLHELIAWWALNRGHAREGDPQMADFYRGEFEAALKERSTKWLGGLDTQPLIIGDSGNKARWRAQNGLGPLIYGWE